VNLYELGDGNSQTLNLRNTV